VLRNLAYLDWLGLIPTGRIRLFFLFAHLQPVSEAHGVSSGSSTRLPEESEIIARKPSAPARKFLGRREVSTFEELIYPPPVFYLFFTFGSARIFLPIGPVRVVPTQNARFPFETF